VNGSKDEKRILPAARHASLRGNRAPTPFFEGLQRRSNTEPHCRTGLLRFARNDEIKIVLATHSAPEACQPPRRTESLRFASGNKKGGGAPKDACHPLSVPLFLPSPLRGELGGGRKRAIRRALAFRRFAAALAPASERQDSAQAALHANKRERALPAPSFALKQRTLRSGRNAGGAWQF